MAWGGKKNYSGKGKKSKGTRITGLFKTKRKGLYVGRMRSEEIKGIRVLLKKAADEGKEVAVFMYKNEVEEGKPLFSLKADIQTDFKGKKKSNDDFEDDVDGEEETEGGDEGEAEEDEVNV